MFTNDNIIKLVDEQYAYMQDVRRHLHEYPELSSNEFNTSKFLKSEIVKLGLEVIDVEGTGFYAILDTSRPGKVIGLRTDIDALPITENSFNLNKERSVISKNEGLMHACGHDGHMATTLAAAKVLCNIKDQLNGKFVFIFEEGEEIGSGIDAMLQSLKHIDFDVIYGTHLAAFMDTGKISVDSGPIMAGIIGVDFDVIGRGGHGSRPDLSINPIFATANILTSLASAWANQIDVSKTVTLGITQINGGSAMNVIADRATVKGSLRFYDEAEGLHALEVLKHVVTKTAEAHLCTIEFDEETRIINDPVVNDDYYSKVARDGVSDLFKDSLIEDSIWYASESFSKYSSLAPTVFAFVGVRNEEVGSGAEHHNEYFDIDEKGMYYSLGATLKFIINNQ